MGQKPNEWRGAAFLEPFRGRWVAVAGERVLVHGESQQQVRAKLRILHQVADDVLLVPNAPKWKKEAVES